MSSPLHRPSSPPPQRPPTASTVSFPPLPINSSSLPKSPPSLSSLFSSASASASASVSASASASSLYVCNPSVAVDVLIVPVLAVIVIFRPPFSYCHRPCHFLSLVMGSVTCLHFVPEATERLVQQKMIWLENPRPSENRGVST